jgi:hypothetical protein
MAFTKQGGNIEQALISGGLSPMAANAMMYAIANCAQPLEHRGPFTINYVPQQVRMTTPERAKYSYQKFDFQTSEGERRPLKRNPPDEPPPPYEPDFPPPDEGGCDLTTACDRMNALESAMGEAFKQLEMAAAVAAKMAYNAEQQGKKLQELEDKLNDTTECPSDSA